MSFCKDCFKGVRHDGTVEGKMETIAGIQCYVGTPTVDYPKDKVILYLADAFGLPLVNNQLLVDDFARNGFKTILPDYFNGDPVPEDIMTSGKSFDIPAWIGAHNPGVTRPILDKVIDALKAEGVTSFAAVGFCFGGRYTFDLAFDGVIKVAAVSHPSLLKVPEDLEKYASTAKAPLLINSCTTDEQFPLSAQAKADSILAGFAPGYKREYFDGCTHGFAVRGDMSDPKVKAGKEGAFKATVEWFHEYL
ncbi:Alpha/Beta hydrolase protein [Roridomyces roridus]|uniref:Alpha/Beta hydrolase protein n=1 Tax=Roridomyces roridus TaxID=1738132 RepID=A0AAD7F999_9AGAR|nr:Alpha/Beta hydrolase protein [Roridomyces roridus]